ncbi:MAG: porphobilinogen synthase [Deltaproteobacteria bacterium]|nr:porphobilinogen synthase [Deltaproteobacteria bacterium]
MAYPESRPRRLRQSEALRSMVRETWLRPSDFMWPLFVVPGKGVRQPIASMPGQARLSPDLVVEEVRKAWALGVRSVILFGLPEAKDPVGSHAYKKDGPVPLAVRALRDALPELLVATDVCLCEYTDHGHCGVVEKGIVRNDETLELLAKEALTHARAGAQMVAPSDMMDGRVGFIRETLDEEGFEDVVIMAYSAKYASVFYGPFRDAADSAPAFGDRRSYQMDPANHLEAIREVTLDEEEGADIVMVKPAGPYLDIVRAVREHTDLPLAAYQVSGEYAMIHAAAERGWLDLERAMMESLLGIKRAGADIILTYFAPEAAKVLAR